MGDDGRGGWASCDLSAWACQCATAENEHQRRRLRHGAECSAKPMGLAARSICFCNTPIDAPQTVMFFSPSKPHLRAYSQQTQSDVEARLIMINLASPKFNLNKKVIKFLTIFCLFINFFAPNAFASDDKVTQCHEMDQETIK